MIKGEKIGRCDNCLKENKQVILTVSPNMIQGQVCVMCYKKVVEQ